MSRPVIRLIVSIDTEEDNWIAARRDITTRNIDQLPGLDRRFEALGVRATYFTNWQVAAQPGSAAVMRALHDTGRSEIGAHLHPWNTPPLLPIDSETMLFRLPADVQAAKIATVTDTLTQLLGVTPRAFRAGRFGLGPETVRALNAAGYAIDSSVTPFISWEKYDRGPSHVGAPLHMYRLSGDGDVRVPDRGPLVEVPLSCGFHRWHPASWPKLQAAFSGPLAERLHLAGFASRLEIARSVILSPEIHGTADLHGLSQRLIDGGLPFLHLFWHSPSMMPGLSPFCQTQRDVDQLMARFERLLELLDQTVSLRFVTISEAVAELGVPERVRTSSEHADGRLAPRISPAATGAPDGLVEPVSVVDVPVAADPVEAGPVAADAGEAAPVGRMGRHTMIYLAGILIGRGMSFIMLPFYTRYLTTADYGIMQLMEMMLDIIAIVAGARIASGVHRFYFKAETEAERHAVLSTAMAVIGISFTTFGILTYLFAERLTTLVLGGPEHANLLRIAAVTFGLQSLIIVPSAVLQMHKRSMLITGLTTTKIFVQMSLNIVMLAGVGLGLKGVFLSTLIANIAMAMFFAVTAVRRIGFRLSGPAARSLLRYGLPLVGTQFASFFVTFGDRYFLRVSADVSTVGLYSLAYQFGFIVAAIGYAPFAMVWEPTRFQVASRPDRDALYSRAFLFMNVILLMASVATSLYVRDFIFVMSAPEYHSAYQIVPIILLAYVLQSWGYFHEVGILLRERTSWLTFANWVAAGVAFLGYTLLVPRWLGWGAAVTTVLAFLVRWMITHFVSQRLLPVRYEWGPVWRIVALSTVFVLLGIALPHPGVVLSLAMRTVLLVLYVWMVWHLGVVQPDEKEKILSFVRSPRAALRGLIG